MFLGETTTVVSVGEREAREVVSMAMNHAKVLEKLGSKWAACKLRDEGIRFNNGGRILALPASSGGRGFSGNVFLDEFAYLEKPQDVWDGAAAVVMHGYSKMRVSSTPNGVGNAFHNLWTNPREHEGWSLHKITLDDARADGLEVPDDVCWKMAKGNPRVYAQLFQCSFLDGNEQYIPTELVQGAIVDDTSVEFGEYYAGYDVGYQNDLSALVILRQTPDNRTWIQKVLVGQRTDWEKQQEMIFQAFYDYPIKKMCIDSSGLGLGLVKALEKQIGYRVQGVNFTLQKKEELATDMYQAFADKMIAIPNDPALVQDVVAIRRIITTAGKVTYDAPRTAEGHADRAWALALAIHACSNKPGKRIAKGDGDFESTL